MKRTLLLLGIGLVALTGGTVLAQAIPSEFYDGIKIFDDAFLIFGTDEDIQIEYDEDGDNRLEYSDGTNLMMHLTDAGTTGNLVVTGTMTATSYAGDGSALTGVAALPVADTTAVVKGSVDATKTVKIEADGISASTARTITMPDQDVNLTPGSTFQAVDSDLTTIAALTPTKGNLLGGNGSAWIALGVGANNTVLTADAAQTIGFKWATNGNANGDLSNLTNPTAINRSLTPDTDNTYHLGGGTTRWSNAYFRTIRGGTTAADPLQFQAYDTDGASWTTFFTLTAGDTPTAVLASSVTGVTQGAGDNSTALATTAYVDGSGAVLPVLDTVTLVTGSADTTKKIRLEADGITASTTRVITMPDRDVNLGTLQTESFIIAASNETTAITTGDGKATFRMPYAFTVTEVRASLTTTSSSGTPTFNIRETGGDILSTAITIDAGDTTSEDATTPPVISDASLADDAEIKIDFDVAGTGAKGVKIYIIGRQP